MFVENVDTKVWSVGAGFNSRTPVTSTRILFRRCLPVGRQGGTKSLPDPASHWQAGARRTEPDPSSTGRFRVIPVFCPAKSGAKYRD